MGSDKKKEKPPLPPCGVRTDSIPPNELIPSDLPVFFAPYSQAPVSPTVVTRHLSAGGVVSFDDDANKNSDEAEEGAEFKDIKPEEAAEVQCDDGKTGLEERQMLDAAGEKRSETQDGAPTVVGVVPSPQEILTAASPLTTTPDAYHPEKEEQEKEQEALKEFAALIDKDHKGIDDTTTPTGPLPKRCDRQQFLYARDLARLRFLRARKLDPVEAVKQYVTTMEWRKEHEVDTILDAPDSHEALYHCVCPHRNHGFDRWGHPVYYEKTGGVRMPKFLKYLSEDDLVRRHIRMMEHTIRRTMYSSALNGRNVEKMTLVMDMAGMEYTIETTGLKVFKRTTKIDQDFYPERLHKMFIINAPMTFRGVWAMVRPWLDPKTQTKIQVLGGKYHKTLEETIHPDQIPKSLGGNCDVTYPNGDGSIQLPREYGDDDVVAGWHTVF